MGAAKYFPEEEQHKIEQAIADAESESSGEIRVHIESHCPEDVLDRAAYIFDELGMQNTELRNGVLIYLATESKKYGIIGDAGINHKVNDGNWRSIEKKMHAACVEQKLTQALCCAVEEAGKLLKEHFPIRAKNSNELDNTISFGA